MWLPDFSGPAHPRQLAEVLVESRECRQELTVQGWEFDPRYEMLLLLRVLRAGEVIVSNVAHVLLVEIEDAYDPLLVLISARDRCQTQLASHGQIRMRAVVPVLPVRWERGQDAQDAQDLVHH